MDIVISDENGVPFMQTSDFSLDIQRGSRNDFELNSPVHLEKHWRFHVDGTGIGGFLDTPCPSKTAKGDFIKFKGRSLEGLFEKKVLKPPGGSTHLTFRGDANAMLADIVQRTGLSGVFEAETDASGLPQLDYRFYRYVRGWTGIRMALASVGARPDILCREGKHLIRALPDREYGRLDSERVFFEMECEELPCNSLVGLGKGEGLARPTCHWYADLFGNVSQTQTLFGEWEVEDRYVLTNEEGESLSRKTKAKLLELQEGSKATVNVPEGVRLGVGDTVSISSAHYRQQATTQVTDIVTKVAKGIEKTDYRFGLPDFPDEEEE